jgi:hypothetical protein
MTSYYPTLLAAVAFMLRAILQIAFWVVVGPVLLAAGACLFVLDQLLPRYLLAAALVAPFALAAHSLADAPLEPFGIAVLVIGTLLAGLWENCEVFSGRSLLRLLFRRPNRE